MVTDPYASAAYRNALDHVAGPLRAGASDAPLGVAADGTVAVGWTTREPLLVIAPLADLDTAQVTVTAAVTGGTGTPMPPAVFAPFTERGAFVPLFRPAVDPAARTAPPFALALRATGAAGPLDPAALAGLVEVRLIEGITGRLAFLLSAEQPRLRRTMQVLRASRRLATAQDEALDRLGADLGVPRFDDALAYDAVRGEVYSRSLPAGEPDDAYRTRLRLFRPFALPTPGATAAKLAAAGIPGVTFGENERPFAIAVHLVAVGQPVPAAVRANVLQHVRDVYLVPLGATSSNPVVASRFGALRDALAQHYTAPPATALAAPLAEALLLAGQVRSALLGAGAPALAIARGQADAGSRYELGLGCDLVQPAAERAQLAALVAAAAPADAAVAAAVTAMRAALAGGPPDSAAAWFWTACGLRTVEPLDAQTLYLSPTAVGALTIADGPVAGPQVTYTALRRTVDDPNTDAALAAAVAATQARWLAAGRAAWSTLSAADAAAAWKGIVARPAADPVGQALAAAGLPALTDPAGTAGRLAAIPAAMVRTVLLAPADAAAVLAHDAAAVALLRGLVASAQRSAVPSMLVFTGAGNTVGIAFAGIALPGAGTLGDGAPPTVRWAVASLFGAQPLVQASGDTIALTVGQPGVFALIAIDLDRTGAVDPYEAEVILPDGALLDLTRYELLMNALTGACPIGVRINTWQLRRGHVDLDGDGQPDPLTPRASRTFRQFRRPRYRGEGPAASGSS